MTGSGNPMYGRKHSIKTIKKISEARKGQNTNTEESNEKKRQVWLSNNPMNDIKLKEKAAYNRASDYILTNPYGITFEVHNLSQFCRENKLDVCNLVSVSTGKLKHSKGWKCQKVNSINTITN